MQMRTRVKSLAEQQFNPRLPYSINTLSHSDWGRICLFPGPQLEKWSSLSAFEGTQVSPDKGCFPVSFTDFSPFPQGRKTIPPDQLLHISQKARYGLHIYSPAPCGLGMTPYLVWNLQQNWWWGRLWKENKKEKIRGKESRGLLKQNKYNSSGLSNGRQQKAVHINITQLNSESDLEPCLDIGRQVQNLCLCRHKASSLPCSSQQKKRLSFIIKHLHDHFLLTKTPSTLQYEIKGSIMFCKLLFKADIKTLKFF